MPQYPLISGKNHTNTKHSDVPCKREARRFAERLVNRADHLPTPERDLLLAVYARGQTVQDLARLAAVSRAVAAGHGSRVGAGEANGARRLRRQIRQIVRRVLSPEFAFVAAHRETWTPTMRRVASECVLAGRSLRATARELKLSYHTVRRYREAVLALCDAAIAGAVARAPAGGGRSGEGAAA